ncbi:hypothetical protein JCM8202v2_003229 [Rhodotorula sphaerocarpa]
MAAMLRLGSRGSLSPPTSPSRVRTIRRPTSSAAPRPSAQGDGPPDWRGSSRLPTSPSSSLSWLPQTPSAPPRSSPPSPSTIPTTTPSSSTNPLPSFTQQDLDVLVEGIDFDDGFETEFLQDDLKASGPPAASPLPASASPRKVLPEHELDELVSGIDFSQDLQIDSDEDDKPNAGYVTRREIDLIDSESDEDLVVVSSRRRAPVQEVQKENVPVASAPTPAIPEFFAKPEGLRPAAPAPKPTANKPLTEPGARRAAARVKRDAKASDHAQRQSEFRQRWPRIFSYKTWHKDVRVVYTTNEDVIERELRGMEGPLGFDLEWDSFSGYRTQGKTALAQISDEKTVLLVHVARMNRFSPALRSLIEDPDRIKLGVQIAGDASKLVRDFGHAPKGTLDINACVHHYDPQRYHGRRRAGLIGLQELAGIYLDRFLPKETAVRTGRWSAPLGPEQTEYAANDVYASVHIVKQIQMLAGVPDDRLEADLLALSRRPFSAWTGFGPESSTTASEFRAPAGKPSLPAKPDVEASSGPASPEQVLSPRRYQAFSLFHRHELSLADVTTRMSDPAPIKPVTVVWNLLNAHAVLERHAINVAWDVPRLVAAMDEIGPWPARMEEEHGDLAAKLRELRAVQRS